MNTNMALDNSQGTRNSGYLPLFPLSIQQQEALRLPSNFAPPPLFL